MRALVVVTLLLTACGGRMSEEARAFADAHEEPEVAPDVSVVAEDSSADSGLDVSVTVDAHDAADTAVCDTGFSWTARCVNGIDDDGDGLVDWLDPECTSPLDDDEGSFAYGWVDEYSDPCKSDCVFDGNSGSGDDGCVFSGQCLVGSPDPRCPYDPAAAADPVRCPAPSKKCIEYCAPRAPNGCDCSGCCDVFDATGKSKRVRIYGWGCSLSKLDDPKYCPPCEMRTDCARPCGRCDYCLGKTSIPSDCTDEMKTACPAGAERCGADKPCPCGELCLTGCCAKR